MPAREKARLVVGSRIPARIKDRDGAVDNEPMTHLNADQAARRAPAQPIASISGNGPVVLVAEDIAVNQVVASRLLETRGLRVVVAGDGRQAVELARNGGFCAIFMDCQMPELDGYEATAEIRRTEPAGVHVTIIAMTAHVLEGDRERCLAAGMDDYVTKPVSFSDLDRVLAPLLARAAGGRRTPRPLREAVGPGPDP
jgi:CheY-like chemotaxis protein